MFGVLIMMIMNPSTSSYRSLYTADNSDKESGLLLWLRRHMAKLIVSLFVFLFVFSSFLIINTKASGSTVEGPRETEQVVTVGSGETLWTIASRLKDGNDIGYLVFVIKDRNGLDSELIHPGQKLIIPKV